MACVRMFGCSNLDEFKELTGYTFSGMVYPDDFKKIQASIDSQIADQNNDNLDYVEYRIKRKDRRIRWVDDYGHFAELPGYGDVYYVFISDITDKHMAQEENHRKANIYEGMLKQFNDISADSLAVVRFNLTTGLIEEVRGTDLYDCDKAGTSMLNFFDSREESLLIKEERDKYYETFRVGTLLDRFYAGEGVSSMVGFCQRQSGRKCFVKFSGSAFVDPTSYESYALLAEREYNFEKITRVIDRQVLVKQYDLIASLVGDYYGIVLGEKRALDEACIFPDHKDGVYTDYINNQIVPYVSDNAEDIARKLSLGRIIKELKESDEYTVDVSLHIQGRDLKKRFAFYTVDEGTMFYILLRSDIK